jgi:hypothetical protein
MDPGIFSIYILPPWVLKRGGGGGTHVRLEGRERTHPHPARSAGPSVPTRQHLYRHQHGPRQQYIVKKKENQIFLIYQEIQIVSVAKLLI